MFAQNLEHNTTPDAVFQGQRNIWGHRSSECSLTASSADQCDGIGVYTE